MKVEVLTHIEIEGFHFWSLAPEEVSFLKHSHRHIFTIKCSWVVEDLDRELEIFMEEWKIKKWIKENYGEPADFRGMSCEMIALAIMTQFNCSSVEVLEDGKGGAKIWR